MRRGVLQAGAALGLGLLLPPVRACEIVTFHFKVLHPWARATEPEATSAAVCMAFEDVTESDRLLGASTPIAGGAQMGGAGAGPMVHFDIPAGQSSALTETGTYLRLVDLNGPLQIGRSYPLTLVFQKAGTVNATLSIDYPRFR